MNKIKVVQMVEDMKVGGLERVIANIALGIDRGRYANEVWCLSRGGAVADELERLGCAVTVMGVDNYHRPRQLLGLIGRLRKARPDIVHTHGYFAGTAGRIAAKMTGVPVVIHHVHSTYWGYRTKNLLTERLLALGTARVACCSQAVARFVLDTEKISSTKVSVIYNGIREPQAGAKAAAALRRELNLCPDDQVVGTVASLTPHKGHRHLLEAAAKVVRRVPRAKFLLVGDGPLRRELIRQADALGITSHLTFCGVRQDVPDLLALMDLFVLPSCEREGLGITLIEAMACGKPVIGTAIGGIPEVISAEVTGLLVPPADSRALAEAMGSLLHDPDRRRRMGEAGLMIFRQRFRSEDMVSRIEAMYEEEIARRERPI